MKRAGNLLDLVIDRDNLRDAFHKAQRGKRARADAQQFAQALDGNLARMALALQTGTFPFGRFQQFVIHDPKERLISAPCFAERVAHHALMNVCEPILDRWLIGDTFACRRGKGRVAALLRARAFAGRHMFFLKLDIRKYFDSIPHTNLLRRLRRRFKDERVLRLFAQIIGAFGSMQRGLPIGSLMSQHFANFYLGWMDRFVKEQLRMPGYVRYMDDMAIWSDDPRQLRQVLAAATHWLRAELELEVKALPYINRTERGMDFLGARVFRDRMVLNRRSRVRFRRKLRTLEERFAAGALTEAELQRRATALVAFTRTRGLSSWRFRRAVVN